MGVVAALMWEGDRGMRQLHVWTKSQHEQSQKQSEKKGEILQDANSEQCV
jgi:hypothetical protein